jgi:acyl carrier protein phosphodiesterase
MNASPLEATRRVDQNTDEAIRIRACRAIIREAARRVAQVGLGCTVAGVEEIELEDRLERALHDYLKARSSATAARQYIGVTAGMDAIEAHASEVGTQAEREAA